MMCAEHTFLLFHFVLKPFPVRIITPSRRRNNAGRSSSTAAILISAPRESSVQIDPIISTFEYTETPNVATKKLHPLVMMDRKLDLWAMLIASFRLFPLWRSVTYRFVIRIA